MPDLGQEGRQAWQRTQGKDVTGCEHREMAGRFSMALGDGPQWSQRGLRMIFGRSHGRPHLSRHFQRSDLALELQLHLQILGA